MKKFGVVGNAVALLTVVLMFTACTTSSEDYNRGIFNTSNLPYAVPDSDGGYGSFAFDNYGDLLFTVNDADEIRQMDRHSGAVSVVATGVSGGNVLLGMACINNIIYAGDDAGNIFEVNPQTGVSVSIINLSGAEINGLAVAPSGFGSYGGHLIATTDNGDIYAVDQTLAVPTVTLIANIGVTEASALVFGSDGTLYVADNGGGRIVTVTAGGTVANFATGLDEPDGLAVDNSAGIIYVADSGDDMLKSVTIPGGAVTNTASYDFDSGFWPSPILFDPETNILLLGTGEDSLTIRYYSF
jgi:outer membrane protein assembly factor BamB